jgi:uncharacterized protein (TIGR03083 family)
VQAVKITPRYDTGPIIRLDGPPPAIRTPLLRQRRRFARQLSTFTPEQWGAASRCVGWRVQDVVAHLTSTDQFWHFAVSSGLAGTPTRMLESFDPKAVPAALVDAVRDAPAADALAAYVEANDALCALFESLDDAGWDAIGEAPPGHLSISALAHHALWDSWVHERDVLQPLGIAQDEAPDEVLACLRYAAALSPAFALQADGARAGALALVVEQPSAHVLVTVGDDVLVTDDGPPSGALVLRGDAVELLEALSVRRPLHSAVSDEHAWLLVGLREVFETTPAG